MQQDQSAKPQDLKAQQPGKSAPTPSAPATTNESQPPQAEAAPRADVPLVQLPPSVRDEAERENMHRDLAQRLAAANQPKVDTYVPPAVPEQIAKTTQAEMAAGAKRVAEFAELEAIRKQMNATRAAEAWEGKNTAVFRPGDVAEYKNIKAPNVSKDAVAQPRR